MRAAAFVTIGHFECSDYTKNGLELEEIALRLSRRAVDSAHRPARAVDRAHRALDRTHRDNYL